MGASGSGKSTLAKLIQGFYLPSGGSIESDTRDVRQLSSTELRSQLGVVPQETLLFGGSVYENLQLANPHAGFEEIVAACKTAEIHDTIEKLPKGYRHRWTSKAWASPADSGSGLRSRGRCRIHLHAVPTSC